MKETYSWGELNDGSKFDTEFIDFGYLRQNMGDGKILYRVEDFNDQGVRVTRLSRSFICGD